MNKHCKWTEDNDGNHDTECEQKFAFIDAGPVENGFKFCPYCGKRLQVKP